MYFKLDIESTARSAGSQCQHGAGVLPKLPRLCDVPNCHSVLPASGIFALLGRRIMFIRLNWPIWASFKQWHWDLNEFIHVCYQAANRIDAFLELGPFRVGQFQFDNFFHAA